MMPRDNNIWTGITDRRPFFRHSLVRSSGQSMRKDGLTLVEVMIAMAILAFSLSCVLMSFTMARKSANMAEGFLTHMHTARATLENIRAKAYDDSTLAPGTYTFSNYRYVVATNSAFGGIKDITVTVWWQNPASKSTSTLSMATSISKAVH